ncbi:hypothetical protein JIN85_20175 [Luteolibacter pohnpeiensis]|uniref:Uncharacterized protein n=1 Tax=Luteolibacter pohnpeiensis TaxID=454153 RepID=A0A934S7Y1_9BACT|nr:hypothetical protein [Luteolibacter pohnpeiensis]MBK1884740.1 hypothetical protein [Luteolibacter pohnpeiensis]
MKRTMSLFSLIVGLIFLILLVRSRGLDEGFEFGNEYLTESGFRNEWFLSFGWGPHGIRLFRRLESENLTIEKDKDEIGQFVSTLDGGTWDAWSAPYEKCISWGWPVETFWNRQGFWWSDQRFKGDNEWRRRISLVAVPLWLPVGVFVAFSFIPFVGTRRNRRAEQVGAPNR